MKRYLCVFLVRALSLQTAPLALAGEQGSIVILDKGTGGPINFDPDSGQSYPHPGQHPGQSDWVIIDNGQGGNPNHPSQQDDFPFPIHQSPDQTGASIIPTAPSGFATYQHQYVQNGLRDYRRGCRRRRRGESIVISCYPPYNHQGQEYSEGELELLRMYAQQEHEREMARMQLDYREREIARIEAQRAEERKQRTNMALFQCMAFTIPMVFSSIHANREARDRRQEYQRYDQRWQQRY